MSKAIESISDVDVSYADLRQEVRDGTQVMVVNGDLRRMSQTNRAGTVARVLIGECWGQASTTSEATPERLRTLLEDAKKIAIANARHSRKKIELLGVNSEEKTVWQSVKEDPDKVSIEEKIGFAKALDKEQKIDDRIVNTNAWYTDSKNVTRLVNTAGAKLQWNEIRVRFFSNPVAREGDRMQYDYGTSGAMSGFELVRGIDPVEFSAKAAKGALDLLKAVKPPSGKITTILDGELAGIVAHEVCGHGSEADEVVKGRSFLTGMVGKQVGTEHVTMLDDGTLDGKAGSIPFDSEGTPGSKTYIMENGIFKGYMHTLETAAIMGVSPTGNGRAQDYNRRVFARMTNTFFGPGDWNTEEMIQDTKDGLYVIKGLSGMEDVVGGGVQVSALKGYVIKNGEKTDLVRSVTLAGKVLDILKTVDAVSKELDFSGGNCGKGEEDWVSVTTGGPHMRAEIIVGGD